MTSRLVANVDGRAARWRRLRARAVWSGAVLAGIVIASAQVTLVARRPRPVVIAPIAQLHSVLVPVAVPAPAPAAPPVPASTATRCPILDDTADEAIGTAWSLIGRDEVPEDPPAIRQVVAAARAPRIAMLLATGEVRVSDDDGRTFARVHTADRAIDELRIDRDGVVYARAGAALGVLGDADRSWHWREVGVAMCNEEICSDRLAVVDDVLVWIHDAALATSRDRGKTWRRLPADRPWSTEQGELLAWRGALYQVEHYQDMCGVDDSPTWRLDVATGNVANTIFHNEYLGSERVLLADDDVGTAWTWHERCRAPDAARLVACTDRSRELSAMLAVKTLRPVEGARVLAVFEHGLVELCGDGARQIYRAFPFDHVDAVDAIGRPLVARGRELLRWSGKHGWRRLARVPAATPPGGD